MRMLNLPADREENNVYLQGSRPYQDAARSVIIMTRSTGKPFKKDSRDFASLDEKREKGGDIYRSYLYLPEEVPVPSDVDPIFNDAMVTQG